MANYCSNCGSKADNNASYCSNCGSPLNGTSSYASQTATTTSTSDILGTLVAVSLVGGITRQLYYYNGRYFFDPYCRRPFVGPRIIGPHRPMGMPHGPAPHGMFRGAPHGPGGFGGPHGGPGGFGGPHGGPGGPRGGRR